MQFPNGDSVPALFSFVWARNLASHMKRSTVYSRANATWLASRIRFAHVTSEARARYL
jgi:hypothetical protein